MTKLDVSALRNVLFYPGPVPLIISDTFAARTDWKKTAEHANLVVCRPQLANRVRKMPDTTTDSER